MCADPHLRFSLVVLCINYIYIYILAHLGLASLLAVPRHAIVQLIYNFNFR